MIKTLKRNLVKLADAIFALNFYTNKFWKSWRMKIGMEKSIILVYSDGKVGSTSITLSLKRILLKNFYVYHIHRLSKESLESVWKYYKDRKNKVKVPDNVFYSSNLIKLINKGLNISTIRVVTAVRDPIAAVVSEICENTFYGKEKKYKGMNRDAVINDLRKSVNDRIENTDIMDNRLSWFDREFKIALNVDVYSMNFDKNQGFSIIKGAGLPDILILKLEKMNYCIAQAMNEFLVIDGFQLIKGNTAATKYYAETYKLLLNRISFSTEFLNKVYNSKYANHFYNEDEIEHFKIKWSRQ